MADKLNVDDRVRITHSTRVFRITEIDPPGCKPYPPATFTARLTPEDGKGPDQLSGNLVLTKVE